MISAIIHSQGIIALISIVFLLGCRLTINLHPIIDFINPATMSKLAMQVLITGSINVNAIGNVLVGFVWIFITLIITNYWIGHKKFNNE